VVVVAGGVGLRVRLDDDRPHLVWSDEFSGPSGAAPNRAHWTFDTGGAGWGNGELECYTDSRANSALDGRGHLVITARSDPDHACSGGTTNAYTSARLTTADLQTVRYGHIRVRAQLPTAPGTWPAIWALGADHATVGWPRSGEIDIDEGFGSEPGVAIGSVHGPGAHGVPYSFGGRTKISGPVSGFHIYGLDWTPWSIDFSLDGKIYYGVTKAAVQRQGRWVFDKPFYLLLNLAIGGGLPGPPTSATSWPQQLVVDYVRVTS
jgi:beta-glucanase (GH16 family)